MRYMADEIALKKYIVKLLDGSSFTVHAEHMDVGAQLLFFNGGDVVASFQTWERALLDGSTTEHTPGT